MGIGLVLGRDAGAARGAPPASSSRPQAQTAMPRTSGDASASRATAASARSGHRNCRSRSCTLRRKRSRPVRLTGVPAKKRPESRIVEPGEIRERRARPRSARAARRVSAAVRANLFQGQTARQSSQPKTRLPIAGAERRAGSARHARSSDTRCSAAHRAGRAPGTHPSGRRRGRRGRSRNGRAPARPARTPRWCRSRRGAASCRAGGRSAPCACPASRGRPPPPAVFSMTGAVSQNTFTRTSPLAER